MRFVVFDALQQIRLKWPVESPKILEKLLAISFDPMRGGFEVESRSTEGVDICLVAATGKYAVEVKTTSGYDVVLEEKDTGGLTDKSKKDGYHPCVAALRLDLLDEWIIARAERLAPGRYTMARLRLDSIPELESIAKIQFERAVIEFLGSILNPPGGSPLNFLASVLQRESRLDQPAT